jgi:hypothetical protein
MNNPPAFPCFDYIAQDGKENPKGMTLRDYFAAKAMQAVMANSGGVWSSHKLETYALIAYALADAMMKAREA